MRIYTWCDTGIILRLAINITGWFISIWIWIINAPRSFSMQLLYGFQQISNTLWEDHSSCVAGICKEVCRVFNQNGFPRKLWQTKSLPGSIFSIQVSDLSSCLWSVHSNNQRQIVGHGMAYRLTPMAFMDISFYFLIYFFMFQSTCFLLWSYGYR